MGMLTVKDLEKACKEQIKKGNGDKMVMLSRDDEGNGFHQMFYLFTDKKKDLEMLLKYEHVDDINKVVILG